MEEEKRSADEDYEKLLEEYKFQLPTSGEIVKGKILEVRDKEVIVDIGSKIEGAIPLEEFTNWKGEVEVNPGDEVEAIVEKPSSREGYIPLSKKKLEVKRALEEINKAFREERPVEGTIVKKEKKGFLVEIQGVRAFLPGSQLEIRPVKETYKYIGKTFPMKVLDIRKTRNAISIIVSRRVLIEEELKKKKEEALSRIKEGEWIKGIVKNITDFGVFVDLGGIDGLLPLSEISWGRVYDPRKFFEEGQEIEVLVLKFDPEKEKITLGYKQKMPDPWDGIEEKYKRGDRVKGRVVSLTEFGAFIELEKGVEGLVRNRELSWAEHIKDPHQIMSEGEIVEVEVLDVNPKERKIALSYKRTLPTPLEIYSATHNPGEIVKGKVKDIKDFGAFIELEPGVEALLRKSDFAWERIEDLKEHMKEGEEIEVKILEINPKEGKIRVSRKHLMEDPFEKFAEEHAEGEELEATVVEKTEKGLILELVPGVTAFIGKPKKEINIGDTVKVQLVNLDKDRRKLRVIPSREKREKKPKRSGKKIDVKEAKKPTLGDILPDELKDLKK